MYFFQTFVLVFLVNVGFISVQCKNILFFVPVGAYSHRMSVWPLVEALADKGHEVTFLSGYELKTPHPKIHDYVPKKWKEAMGPWEEHIKFFDVRKNQRMVASWFDLGNMGLFACKVLYTDPEFVNWIKTSKFDLVFVDALMNDCAYGLIHLHKAKHILYGTTTVNSWFFDAYGLPDESSSVTELAFNFPPGKKMSFFQRFANAIQPIIWTLVRQYSYFPKIEEISRNGLGELAKDLPSFAEMERNACLVMITTHYSLDYPRSFPPNVIPVGGIAAAGSPKPLPKEFEDLANKSKNGFIFISFGTVTEFTNFDPNVRQEFINAVGSFTEIQFIWKCSFEIVEKIPRNVFVTKWAPQLSLLAHKNIKAFISHTGMGSTVEAIQHSVPVIALPVLTDQDLNGEVLASRGAAIKLEITTLKQQELVDAIKEILANPTYKVQMTRLSEVYKDRPMTVLQNAVWWTEYVLRHENTNEFLRSPSVGQSWWVRRQLDVWVFAVVLVLIIICTPIYMVCYLLKKLGKMLGKSTVKSKKQKRN